MDFDAYEYLEKTVEENDDRDSKRKSKSKEGTERSYRKRDMDEDDPALADGDDRKSKRSRADDENGGDKRDRDRDRERSSHRDKDRHHRDPEREKDRERERERERERSSRDKDKERERERRERDKERERREKEKEKEREREREREKRERDEKERSRRSQSRSDRDRERDRDLEMRESRRFKDKKEVVEPEADPERDQRTVFAYQMPLKATERDVYEFFSRAGKVRDVRLIMDRNSRRSKGVGPSDPSKETQLELSALEFLFPYISLLYALYIEFYDAMSVPMAIALSGQLLLGQPVMVKPSEAEKNLVQSNASTGGSSGLAGPYGAVDRKLYVGNLHFNMTETQLRAIFEPFGPVELVQLPLDLETGHCKGFGFVQFAKLEDAKAAQSLNGKVEIAGRTIKVSSVTDHVGAQDTGAKTADFDDDDGGGLSLNAQSRALLMQKLDRSGIATSIAGSLGVPMINGSAPNPQAINLPVNGQAAVSVPALPAQAIPTPATEPVGIPSECLLLKNMFDPATEMDPDFDMDIKEDVEEECSKYGRVRHAHVDKNSAGFVYLRFETVEGAMAAQSAMHLRWFARRLISALFMQPDVYEAKFNGGA